MDLSSFSLLSSFALHSLPFSRSNWVKQIIYAFELIFSAFYAADIVCRAIVNGWRYFFKTPSRLIFIFTVVVCLFPFVPYIYIYICCLLITNPGDCCRCDSSTGFGRLSPPHAMHSPLPPPYEEWNPPRDHLHHRAHHPSARRSRPPHCNPHGHICRCWRSGTPSRPYLCSHLTLSMSSLLISFCPSFCFL